MRKMENNEKPAKDTTGELHSESEVSTEKLLELPDEELKTKYGIDDPRNWKSYQRALHKEQRERAEEKKKFEQMLNQRDEIFRAELGKYQTQFEQVLKPKEVELKPPVLTDPDDPVALTKYNHAMLEYNNAIWEKRYRGLEEKIGKTTEQIEAEREQQRKIQELETVKSYSKGMWIQEGLTPEEAEECWNWQASAKGDERLKALAKMFKHSKGNGQDVNRILEDRAKLKMPGFLPGAGMGGGASADKLDPNEFTKSSDHSDLYKKK